MVCNKFLADHQWSVWDNMTFVYPSPLSCLLLVFLYEITAICLQPATFSLITFTFLYFFLCFKLLTFKTVSIIYTSIVLLKYVLHFTDGEERQRINISLFWFRLLTPGKGHKVLLEEASPMKAITCLWNLLGEAVLWKADWGTTLYVLLMVLREIVRQECNGHNLCFWKMPMSI